MSTMVTQFDMFDYTQIEELGDLERISMCFSVIPMQSLINTLDNDRKNGRNDYTNETMKTIDRKKYVSLIPLSNCAGNC